jgi:hypothetical protein
VDVTVLFVANIVDRAGDLATSISDREAIGVVDALQGLGGARTAERSRCLLALPTTAFCPPPRHLALQPALLTCSLGLVSLPRSLCLALR